MRMGAIFFGRITTYQFSIVDHVWRGLYSSIYIFCHFWITHMSFVHTFGIISLTSHLVLLPLWQTESISTIDTVRFLLAHLSMKTLIVLIKIWSHWFIYVPKTSMLGYYYSDLSKLPVKIHNFSSSLSERK